MQKSYRMPKKSMKKYKSTQSNKKIPKSASVLQEENF